MEQFFSWPILATESGVALATGLCTQLLKDLGFLKRLPTRLLSFLIALLLLIGAACFTATPTPASLLLTIPNAAVAALAAQGGYTLLTEGIHAGK